MMWKHLIKFLRDTFEERKGIDIWGFTKPTQAIRIRFKLYII